MTDTERASPDSDQQSRALSYGAAITEAMREELLRDPTVFVMGEDVRSPMWLSGSLIDQFEPDRIRNTPISEIGFVGAAIGAAMTGCRPIVDMTIASLLYCAMDQLVSNAAKVRYMSGGQVAVPVVIRAAMHYGNSAGAQHADRPYPMFMGVPGLKVVVPSTAYDAKGLFKSSVRDDAPVLFFEDTTLFGKRSLVPDGEYLIELGQAAVCRPGTDVTVVAIGGAVHHALAAADTLAQEGISVEVIDPRTLVPLDIEAILSSVARTRRLVVADPAHLTCSAASEIAALVAQEGFALLAAPIVRVATPDVTIPFSPVLESTAYPDASKIAAAVRHVQGYGRASSPGTEDPDP